MRKIFKQVLLSVLLALMGGGQALQADNGVKVEDLGTSTTLVRVTGDGRYLMLPIQDSTNDDAIRVIVDGNRVIGYFNARLAKTKVDLYVPLDLGKYAGHQVTLLVQSAQDRNNVRQAKDDICWKNMYVTNSYDTTNTEKYRPAYHHTPLWGWMNDPNGMFYKDGVWHLYYQRNPYGSKWENMTWGHSTSTDLINWEHHDDAIVPNGLGTIFSGSSVIDSNGTAGFGKDAVVALFTSADATQQQSMAVSTDNGMTFEIYPGNPVLTLNTEARDPNMFWDEKNGRWVLSLAHALEGEMLFFTSPDLKTWTLEGSFGKGEGAQGGVWECPDLFELPFENGTKWVLLCNINPGGPFGGSATQYFVGDFDGKTFTADTDASGKIPTKWMDYGKDHYATVSWSDAPGNRRTVIGWMSNWQYAAEVPTRQFRSANTLPRDVKLFRGADGEVYMASEPSPELLKMRGKATVSVKNRSIKNATYRLPSDNDGICEVTANIDANKCDEVILTFSNAKGENSKVVYNPKTNILSFDRTESGLSDFSQDFAGVTVAPTHTAGGTISLRIFIDRSSFEVFGDDGRSCLTNLVFPTEPYTTLTVTAKGGSAKLSNLNIYPINL